MANQQVGNARNALGFTSMGFTVQEVDAEWAYGLDQFRVPRKIPLALLPAKSPYPQPGEQWNISKAMNGIWVFSSILNAPPPVTISGNIESDSLTEGGILQQLLIALGNAGYIINDTYYSSPS